MGERGFLGTITGLLAEALYAQGRPDEAREMTEETQVTAAPGDLEAQARWRVVQTQVLARIGQSPAERALLDEAAGLISPTSRAMLKAQVLTARPKWMGSPRIPSRPRPACAQRCVSKGPARRPARRPGRRRPHQPHHPPGPSRPNRPSYAQKRLCARPAVLLILLCHRSRSAVRANSARAEPLSQSPSVIAFTENRFANGYAGRSRGTTSSHAPGWAPPPEGHGTTPGYAQ
jgi:hypothetical protein